MPDSLVVQVMRANKAALLARETVQMQAMAQRWLQIEQALDAQIAALAEEFARMKRDGITPTQAKLFQMDRYQSLLKQLYAELDTYTGYADTLITGEQRTYANLAIAHSNAALEASGVSVGFDKLPIEAVENAVGLTGDGSPLRTLLTNTWPDAAQAMTSELIKSTALGINPRVTATKMKDGTTRSLNRMLNIARSEQMRIYRTTATESYKASGVVDGFFRLATRDSRTCPACLFDDGHHYRLDETMPEHASGRCLTPGTIVSGPPIEAFVSRHYVGKIIKIRTASGKFLSVTPNHPILTNKGWVGAHLLKTGDSVVCSINSQGASLGIDPNKYQEPTLIENVPSALGMVRLLVVPVTSEDFHGDGKGSDVYIVSANRLLLNDSDSSIDHPVSKHDLGDRNIAGISLPGFCDFASVGKRMFHSDTRNLSYLDSSEVFLHRSVFGQQTIGVHLTTEGSIGDFESRTNGISGDAIGESQRVFGFAGHVASRNLIGRKRGLAELKLSNLLPSDGVLSDFASEQTAGLEFIREELLASVESDSDILRTIASNVSLDCIIEVDTIDFSGHVYNLQTKEHWYIANDIITHNCSQVPGVIGAKPPQWQKGPDWFVGQPPATQQSILGKGRFEAWQGGKFDLDQLIRVKSNETWGDSLQSTPLKELVS